jgi:hypothetical protein
MEMQQTHCYTTWTITLLWKCNMVHRSCYQGKPNMSQYIYIYIYIHTHTHTHTHTQSCSSNTIIATAELLRNSRERRPSIKGDLDWSVTRKLGESIARWWTCLWFIFFCGRWFVSCSVLMVLSEQYEEKQQLVKNLLGEEMTDYN